MMKFSFIAIGIATLVATSCNNGKESETELTTPVSDSVKNPAARQINDSVVLNGSTGDNSENAIDWPGVYFGIIPCADCEGIEMNITLGKDLLYVVTQKYLGKKDAKEFVQKGGVTWNTEGSKITLNGIDHAPNQYLVGENVLIQLDINGNRITGAMATKYHLNRKVN